MNTITLDNTTFTFTINKDRKYYTKLVLEFNGNTISCLDFNKYDIPDSNIFLRSLYNLINECISEREYMLLTGQLGDYNKKNLKSLIKLYRDDLKQLKKLLPIFSGVVLDFQ